MLVFGGAKCFTNENLDAFRVYGADPGGIFVASSKQGT